MADQPDYTRQPAPKVDADAVSAHDRVIEDLDLLFGLRAESAIKQLRERKEYGQKKYGTILHENNGRDHGQDALDEALDLVAYLRTWMEAKPSIRPQLQATYEMALHALIDILRVLDEVNSYQLDPKDTGLAMVFEEFSPNARQNWLCGALHTANGRPSVCLGSLDGHSRCIRHGYRSQET